MTAEDQLAEKTKEAGDSLISVERLKTKLRGGKLALELFGLIADEPYEVRRSIAEAFRIAVCGKQPEKPPEAPEPLEPIARLGSIYLEFGWQNGKCFDDIPLDYLEWLCGKTEDTAKHLKAYLTHPELPGRRQGESA